VAERNQALTGESVLSRAELNWTLTG